MAYTKEELFNLKRRDLIKLLGLAGTAAFFPSLACTKENNTSAAPDLEPTAESIVTTYNNFYEFGFSKRDPAQKAANFNTEGWKLEVGGSVKNPVTLTLPELIKQFGEEQRVYRLRCVEGWIMTIPWKGFELNKLLNLVEPTSSAKYVEFQTLADPQQMPQVAAKSFPFPYIEGLRLDEAMHPLAILALGAYGKPLLPQNGAPIRLVVPWKYGFKSAKSLVKITLKETQPVTTWNSYLPSEYGFYANVNPNVSHPRWSQATERVIGDGGMLRTVRQPTRLFNGYDEVADLYKGMDLKVNY